MTILRKTATAGIAALALAGALAVSPAEAAWRGHRGGGFPVGGIIGGLALGALAAGAANSYYAPGPRYGAYGGYGGCAIERQPAYDRWGRFAGYRRVRVCY